MCVHVCVVYVCVHCIPVRDLVTLVGKQEVKACN